MKTMVLWVLLVAAWGAELERLHPPVLQADHEAHSRSRHKRGVVDDPDNVLLRVKDKQGENAVEAAVALLQRDGREQEMRVVEEIAAELPSSHHNGRHQSSVTDLAAEAAHLAETEPASASSNTRNGDHPGVLVVPPLWRQQQQQQRDASLQQSQQPFLQTTNFFQPGQHGNGGSPVMLDGRHPFLPGQSMFPTTVGGAAGGGGNTMFQQPAMIQTWGSQQQPVPLQQEYGPYPSNAHLTPEDLLFSQAQRTATHPEPVLPVLPPPPVTPP